MRRLVASAVVAVLLLGAALLLAPMPVTGAGRDVLTRYVVCTTTFSHLITANPNRLSVLLQNVGTTHAAVGRRIDGVFIGTTLHAGAVLSMDGYQGGLSCQSTGPTAVEIMETVE